LGGVSSMRDRGVEAVKPLFSIFVRCVAKRN
jgi:hypothetical protein